jgi:hypothetical protein
MMASAWALSRAAEYLVGDNLPAGCEPEIERLATFLDEIMHWQDAKDEWTEAIRAAHPSRSESHGEYGIAMRMVGNRHSKGELVALVNWLLVERRRTRGSR